MRKSRPAVHTRDYNHRLHHGKRRAGGSRGAAPPPEPVRYRCSGSEHGSATLPLISWWRRHWRGGALLCRGTLMWFVRSSNVIQANCRKQLRGLWVEGVRGSPGKAGRTKSANSFCGFNLGSTSAANISNLHHPYLQLVVV